MSKALTIPDRYGDKPVFRPDEASAILSVSKSLVYRLVRNKELASIKKRPVRIPRWSLEEYLNCK